MLACDQLGIYSQAEHVRLSLGQRSMSFFFILQNWKDIVCLGLGILAGFVVCTYGASNSGKHSVTGTGHECQSDPDKKTYVKNLPST